MRKRSGITKKKNSNRLWKIIDDIKIYKSGTLLDDPAYKKDFNAFIILRALAMDEDLISFVNIANEYQGSLSKEEFESIKATGYTKQRIDEILDSIENYKNNDKYKSLNLTVRAWLKRDKDKVVAVSNVQPKYEPEPLPETWAPMPASLKKLASKIGKA